MITYVYDVNGNEYPSEIDGMVVAKRMQHDNHSNHYVLVYGGQFYDPRQSDTPGYKTRNIWGYKPVGSNAFNLYISFLKERRGYLLTHAQREGTR